MDKKIIIYQVLLRLFGNKSKTNKPNGSYTENGSGKFSSINQAALDSLKELGISHVWLTGIIAHASQNSYPKQNISAANSSVVKGIAGSPYAIRDYYDVDPDLADKPSQRFDEFTKLVNRIHKQKLGVIIDFVPNHVAREYQSSCKPEDCADFGSNDNHNIPFSPQNNFYYITNQQFVAPFASPDNRHYMEHTAKATGNDCFSATPSVNDWYETVKLNYGIDYLNGSTQHFDPIPDTWLKMRDILCFWASKKVDGFRCDMAEMVPVAFWNWVIPQVKATYPNIIFIAEVYNPALYRDYIFHGNFDFLYDKVGMYDTLRNVINGHQSANHITGCWQATDDIRSKMLYFLENHDEQRIASSFFHGNPLSAIPAMAVIALMGDNPLLIYAGQELGEKGMDAEGFSGTDGRTTIFDYWNPDTLARYSNNGNFDEQLLNDDEKKLRAIYGQLFSIVNSIEAFKTGKFYDLQWVNQDYNRYNSHRIYSFLRYDSKQIALVIVNFDSNNQHVTIHIPDDAMRLMQCDKTTTMKVSFDYLQFETANRTLSISELETIQLELPAFTPLIAIFDRL